MERATPRTWPEQFERTAFTFESRGGLCGASSVPVEELIADHPFHADPDPIAGADMDALHRKALAMYVRRRVGWLGNELEMARDMCSSPIEKAMLYALAVVAFEYGDAVAFRVGNWFVGGEARPCSELEIEPQAEIDGMRVDFFLTYRREARFPDEEPRSFPRPRPKVDYREASMVVECDGHAFHERTKAQASRDRRRDRALLRLGLPVYRYTGSDIWRQVFEHADEAVRDLVARACNAPASDATEQARGGE